MTTSDKPEKPLGALKKSFENAEWSYAARYLLRQMRLTRAQWFEANRRWLRRFQVSIFAQTWLAMAMIVQSLLALAMAPATESGRVLLSISGIAIAVFLLALSLLENWQDYRKKADQMFTGALEIGHLHDGLRNTLQAEPANHEAVVKATHEYHAILARIPLNHEQVDFENAILSNADFGTLGNVRRAWLTVDTRLRRLLGLYLSYTVVMAIPPLLMWLAYRMR